MRRLFDSVVHLDARGRFAPRFANMLCSTTDFTIFVQVGVDEIEEEFSRVRLCRNSIADPVKVCGRLCDGTEVAGLASGQKAELVELLKCCGGRLVNGRDDDELYRSTV